MNGKIVFFGTSAVCLDFLPALHSHYDLSLIITTPDTIGGRNKRPIEPPVKIFAINNNIPFLQPIKLANKKVKHIIKQIDPKVGIVISFGKLIPNSIINLFTFNIINVHFSLLPLYRGASPVQRAIQNGENLTGITIFEINDKMDEGNIYSQINIPISEDDTSQTLFNKMCNKSPDFLLNTLKLILNSEINKYPQNHSQASYAPKIKKEEGAISWNQSAIEIFNKFRAFNPWPSIFCTLAGRSFKLTKVSPKQINHDYIPGTILKISRDSMIICCSDNSALVIKEFQPPNKKPMTPYCYSLGNSIPEKLD